MKKFLTDLIARKKSEIEELKKKMKESANADEVRSLGDTLIALRDEITEAEGKLEELDKDEDNDNGGEPAPEEGRSFNPLATYGAPVVETNRSDVDPLGTKEYRSAFKDYVQKGTMSDVLQRADDQFESGDLGILMPTTILNEIQKELEKVYGQLYSRVKKYNIKGGVKIPTGGFSATFTRIPETGAPTDRQNPAQAMGEISFTYKIGEIRIAQTLLANILSLPIFEKELSKSIVEAYIKAMDNEILNGVGTNNQMEGILTEANKGGTGRFKTENIIEFTEAEMRDWKKWQEKLFAKIPLAMRNARPEFVMTSFTYEAYIKTLADENNRPVYYETFNPVDGAEISKFKGRNVVFVEDGLGINDFETDGEYFGIYWVPEKGYGINTNLNFAVKRYFDDEKLQWVERAVVINDGKILDPAYIYLLKKKATI